MAIFAVDNHSIMQLVVKGHAGGQQMINVLWYGYKPGLADRSLIHANVNSDFTFVMDTFLGGPIYGQFAACAGVDFHLDELTFRRLASMTKVARAPGYTLNWGDTEVKPLPFEDPLYDGTRPGDPLPTFAAMSVRKKSGVGSRVGRGSLRWGPLAEADTLFQNLTVDQRARVQTAADAVLKLEIDREAGSGVGWAPIVFSPKIVKLRWAADAIPNGTIYLVDDTVQITYAGVLTRCANKITVTVANRTIGRQISRQQRALAN